MKINERLVWLILLMGIGSGALAQVTFTESNLPIIMINTNGEEIKDDPKIVATMGIIDNGPGQTNHPSDPFNDYDGYIGIEIRGSSSQMFPKKQYGIELQDELGEGVEASLLGMPKQEDWVLFAPYNDKTLMRDALAYQLGRELGRYAPRTKFCEVVLNGEYQGVYVLIEKIKRDKNRVDINKLSEDEVSGDDLTGGYIIKVDKSTGDSGEGWASSFPPLHRDGNQIIYFQYEYPKYDAIANPQKQYIQQYVTSMEQALASQQFKDPVNGYRKYLDEDSFIDYFILQEITKNVDGYRLSAFFHKKKDADGGKIHMGPIWDFNLGFGNADYCTTGKPEGLVLEFNKICPGDYWLIPSWWDRLLQDPGFLQKLRARWTSLRANEFQTSKLQTRVDSIANLLSSAQQRNFQQWPVLGQYVWPNYYVGNTYSQEVNWLKSWISLRMAWLDQNMSVITALEKPKMISVDAYPNPTESELILAYQLDQPGKISVILQDLSGRTIRQFEGKYHVMGEQHLDLTDLAPGMYLYQIEHNQLPIYSGKVLKQ